MWWDLLNTATTTRKTSFCAPLFMIKGASLLLISESFQQGFTALLFHQRCKRSAFLNSAFYPTGFWNPSRRIYFKSGGWGTTVKIGALHGLYLLRSVDDLCLLITMKAIWKLGLPSRQSFGGVALLSTSPP